MTALKKSPSSSSSTTDAKSLSKVPYSPLSTPEKASTFSMRDSASCLAEQPVIEPAEKKEVRGWYIYDWANGPFFYSAMNFIPLMITAQAREVAMSDFCATAIMGAQACMATNAWAKNFETEGTCSDLAFDTYSSCMADDALNTWKADLADDARYVNFGGIQIGYASFTQFCTTFSVVLQLIVFITLGSLADFGNNRKRMMVMTNTVGLVALYLVFFMGNDNLYWVNGLLLIVAIVAFSFATVFYNAYLPLLAAAIPSTLEAKAAGVSEEDIMVLEKESTHKISLHGLAAGFSGQLLFLLVNLGILSSIASEKNLNTRVSVAASATWILVFSSVCFYYLKSRPSPPLPPNESYLRHSVTAAVGTLKSFKKLPELGKFLFAYFIFSDGTSTLATSAAVFAQEELNMSGFEIGLALIEVSICAVLGCVFFMWLHESKGVSSLKILATNLAMMGIIPIWGILLMTQKWEFYAAIFLFGINTGSQQAFTRSIYAHHVPTGRESEYFSFYEISDKGTAWLGPLTVGIVFQATGSYRDAFGTLIVFFVVGIGMLLRFTPDVAEKQKKAFDEAAAKEAKDSVMTDESQPMASFS